MLGFFGGVLISIAGVVLVLWLGINQIESPIERGLIWVALAIVVHGVFGNRHSVRVNVDEKTTKEDEFK